AAHAGRHWRLVGPVSRLTSHGITVDLPRGWEGSIHRRDPVAGESTHPVLHAGTFPLPRGRGDYGSAAVDRMHSGDVFVALLEFSHDSAGTALFAREGLPTAVDADSFDPGTLQHSIPGQAGTQLFFNQ